MIVKVRSAGGHNLVIPIPTALFCNRFAAGFAAKAMAQNGWNATPAQMARFFRTAHQCKRRNPGWVMVEVRSAAGDYVYVKL